MKRYYRLLLTLLIFLLLSWTTLHTFLPHAQGSAFQLPSSVGAYWNQVVKSKPPLVVLPPLYPEYFDYEARLPQNDLKLKAGTAAVNAKTKTPKYIKFSNHVRLLGFNNHLQELFLNAQLAYLANRSFAIYEYVWNPAWKDGQHWSVWPEGSGEVEFVEGGGVGRDGGEDEAKGRLIKSNGNKASIIPSRVPASALLGGWIGGGVRMESETDEDDLTPISRPHFDEICPPEERVLLRADEVNDAPLSDYLPTSHSGKAVKESDGEAIMSAWLERLRRDDVKDARCLEIVEGSGQIFDYWLFGTRESISPLWPSLQHGPVMKYWSWSTLVYGAFVRNVLGLDASWPRTKTLVESNESAAERTGMFGDAIKRIVEHESTTKPIPNQYPQYPGGYPYPPLVVDPSKLSVESNDTYRNRPITALPFFQSPSSSSNGSLPFLALHLRRGDFAEHCSNLAEWSSPFTGFASYAADKIPFLGGGVKREGAPGEDAFIVPQVVESETGQEKEGVDVKAERDRDRGRGRVARIHVRATRHGADVDIDSEVTFESAPLYSSQTSPSENYIVSSQEERRAAYLRRCFPNVEEVGKRVGEVVEDWAVWKFVSFVESWARQMARNQENKDLHQCTDIDQCYQKAFAEFRRTLEASLTSVFLLTNGGEAWATDVGEEVGKVLKDLIVKTRVEGVVEATDGSRWVTTRVFDWSNPKWKRLAVVGRRRSEDQRSDEDQQAVLTISSSRNLVLTPEEKYVSQAIDMYIAQRAEVFIGNGFSSMTSNIVMLRLNDGLREVQTRFW